MGKSRGSRQSARRSPAALPALSQPSISSRDLVRASRMRENRDLACGKSGHLACGHSAQLPAAARSVRRIRWGGTALCGTPPAAQPHAASSLRHRPMRRHLVTGGSEVRVRGRDGRMPGDLVRRHRHAPRHHHRRMLPGVHGRHGRHRTRLRQKRAGRTGGVREGTRRAVDGARVGRGRASGVSVRGELSERARARARGWGGSRCGGGART